MAIRLSAQNLRKVFNRRVIFRNISFSVAEHEVLLISGRNGSGKSTLMKILSDVLSPTEGNVELSGTGPVPAGGRAGRIGFVAPYLMLYDEFTARENLRLSLKIRGRHGDEPSIDALLDRVGLGSRKDDAVRTFSSGMKQRVKYALSLIHRPAVLLLDEPTANLDQDGIRIVRGLMEEHRRTGVLVVATNDPGEVDHVDHQVDLNAAG